MSVSSVDSDPDSMAVVVAKNEGEMLVARNAVLEQAVTTLVQPVMAMHLQPLYRGYKTRMVVKEMMRALLKIQTFARQHIARRRFNLAKRSALKLSKTYRMHHIVDHSPVAKLITKARTLSLTLEEERTHERFAVQTLMASAPLLLPGATIALWNTVHGHYLRSDDGKVDGHSVRAQDELPDDHWDAERFHVVATGNGAIALRTHDGLFLRMLVDASGHATVDAATAEPASVMDEAEVDLDLPGKYHGQDTLPWLGGENRFKVIQTGKNEIALYNDQAARFVRMSSRLVVDGEIFVDPLTKKKTKRFHDILQRQKHWERFKVVQLELPFNTPAGKRDALALADALVEYARDPETAANNPEFVRALSRTLSQLREIKNKTTQPSPHELHTQPKEPKSTLLAIM